MRALALIFTAVVAIAADAMSEHRPQNAGLPIVKSDYPLCVTVKPPPLGKAKGLMPTRNSEIS